MGTQKTTRTRILSHILIMVSVALGSGLALGHITEKSMHSRLSAFLPSDPVERFGLGQNAYRTGIGPVEPARTAAPVYAEASFEIGRYKNGARILVPHEPARKIERLRLERLQNWSEQNFSVESEYDEREREYAEEDFADYESIDTGAVKSAPEMAIRRPSVKTVAYSSVDKADIKMLDVRSNEATVVDADRHDSQMQDLSYSDGRHMPDQTIDDRSYNASISFIP